MNQKPGAIIDEETIDLRDLFNVLKKWRKVIVIITILAVLTSGVLSFFILPPVYEAKALLLVTMASDNQRMVINQDNLEQMISTMSRLPQMTMNTYVEQLTSDALLKRVLNKLELQEMGFTTKTLAGMISAQTAKDSNIIELKVRHNNPVLAADVANTLSREYLELLSEKNQEQMSRSTSFITRQKDENDQKLQKALKELEKFNAQPRGVELLRKEFNTLTEDLNRYKSQLDMARIEQQQLEAGVARLQEKLAGISETTTVTKLDPVTSQPVSMEELNPVYVSLLDNLNQKETALAEKEAQIIALEAVVTRLKNDLTKLQAEMSEKEIKHEQLQNEVDRLRETSDLLAQKATQAQIAKSIDLGGTSVIVVSPALVPTVPVKPNKKLNMAVALVLGLMAAVALAFLLEFMDNTIKNADDVNKHLGLPTIGVIPMSRE